VNRAPGSGFQRNTAVCRYFKIFRAAI